MITTVFLSNMENKAMLIYQFVVKGYTFGPDVCKMLADPIVMEVHKVDKYVRNEAHKMLGFVRFSQYHIGGEKENLLTFSVEGEKGLALPQGQTTVLVAIIKTNNQVLPLIVRHFCDRFPDENFIIFDKGNKQALTYFAHKIEIVQMENLVLEQVDKEEMLYRKLWKEYYKTVAIKERYNPTCRRNFMPKQYWEYITEMEDSVTVLPKKDRYYQ